MFAVDRDDERPGAPAYPSNAQRHEADLLRELSDLYDLEVAAAGRAVQQREAAMALATAKARAARRAA